MIRGGRRSEAARRVGWGEVGVRLVLSKFEVVGLLFGVAWEIYCVELLR